MNGDSLGFECVMVEYGQWDKSDESVPRSESSGFLKCCVGGFMILLQAKGVFGSTSNNPRLSNAEFCLQQQFWASAPVTFRVPQKRKHSFLPQGFGEAEEEQLFCV